MIEIVDHKERCVFCRKRKATKLCDFVVGYVWTSIDFQKYAQTCDRQMCDECATNLSEGFDFCPKCVEIAKRKLGMKNEQVRCKCGRLLCDLCKQEHAAKVMRNKHTGKTMNVCETCYQQIWGGINHE